MTTTRTTEDIALYQQKALEVLHKDHPHYEEIRDLLTDQILDDIHDCSTFDRGAITA